MRSPLSRRAAVLIALVIPMPTSTLLAASPSTQPTIQTVNDRAAVSVDDVNRAAAADWLVVSFEPGQQLTVWDVPLTADVPTTAIIGCSSEYQFAMVLDGQLRRDELIAGQGKAMFWSPQVGSKARVMEFSARDQQKSLRASGRGDLADRLNDFAASQDRRRWWGLVRPMKLNIGAPMKVSVDNARKSYLMQPEVLHLRQAAANPADIPRVTAWAMFDHLRAGRTEEIAQLLSPELFLEPAKRNELSQARHAVAASIVAQPWTKQINEGSLRATSDPLKYWFSADKQAFVMTLKPFDQMVYVTSISPETEQ